MPGFNGRSNFGGGTDPIFGIGGIFKLDGGVRLNFSLSYDHSVDDFTASYGLGVTYDSNFYTTGKKGFEIRNSLMLTHHKGDDYTSIGTNLWNGTGELKEFNQRTGTFSMKRGDFSFSYENDGSPFQIFSLLADPKNDSYRTAAASIGIGDYFLDMNLLTGKRDPSSFIEEAGTPPVGEETRKEKKKRKRGKSAGIGKYGEFYKHAHVIEKGTPYRYGGLTLSHKNLSIGANSEWFRHAFQNTVAHRWMQPQRQFEMKSDNYLPVLNYSTQFRSKYTRW